MVISILGLGSFGYALLRHLDRNTEGVMLNAWDVRADIVSELEISRCHPTVGDSGCLTDQVRVISQIEVAVQESDIVFLCVSSEGIESVLRQIKPHLKADVSIINTAKSLDSKGRTISHTVEDILDPFYGKYGVLSGASRAEDVLGGGFVALTFASEHQSLINLGQGLIDSPQFHLETTMDVDATELAGISKNVITLLYGYAKGYGYSITQVEYILAMVMKELEVLKPSLTQKALLPAWIVDIMMSAHSNTRNVTFGYELGQDTNGEDISPDAELSLETVEGWSTLKMLVHHPVLSQSKILMDFRRLVYTKELSHSDWETHLFSE